MNIGENTIHLDEWWGEKVCVDFFLFTSAEMGGYLNSAGFEIEEVVEREPYPEVEHQSRRSYIFARKTTSKAGVKDSISQIHSRWGQNPI